MNLRENRLPVAPPSPDGALGEPAAATGFQQTAYPHAVAMARSPVFNLVRAGALALSGVLTGSQALAAGGCFFLAAAICEFVVVWPSRHASEGSPLSPNARAAASLFLASLIISLAAGLASHGIVLLQAGIAYHRVNPIALSAALASLLVKESGVSATTLVARWVFAATAEARLTVPSSAALASCLVFTGVLGNVAGLTVFDPFAAILLAGLVFRGGWRLVLGSNSP